MSITVTGNNVLAGPFVSQLEALPASDKAQNLVIVAAERAFDTIEHLDRLKGVMSRVVLVGLDDKLDFSDTLKSETLASILDAYRPLGVLRKAAFESWKNVGFIGSKRLAEHLGIAHLKAFQSRYYATWVTSPGKNAADFISMVLSTAELLELSKHPPKDG